MMFLLLILAVGLVSYPFIANYIFEHRADSLVEAVEQQANDMSNEEQNAELAAAKAYNEIVAVGHVRLTDPFIDEEYTGNTDEYESILNMTDDGVMGSVEIPSIGVHIPIYHGTSVTVLEKGTGHLQGTSLPVGGESTHAVITGHSGLSNAKLFTDLEEMVEGDYFFIHVAGQTLAYKVDKISVILPTEMEQLGVYPGKDYVTLVTCTPYSVNTHRLLVRGVRTDYQEIEKNSELIAPKKVESKWMTEYQSALFISLIALIVAVCLLLLIRRLRDNRSQVVDDFI